jgi:hypothetical protein
MILVEMECACYSERSFPSKSVVRDFGDCMVRAADSDKLMLILDDPGHRRVAIFEYDTLSDRAKDIRLIKGIPNGGDGSAVGAVLNPPPPPRFSRHAEQLPDRESGTDH